jgi:archaellum component FlaG (FlaF/FlaG flagellin family)
MAKIKDPKILMLILTIAAVATTALTYAAITVTQDVNSSGTITTTPNIGVYSDIACHNNMTSIAWGTLAAGGTINQTVYVKNTGTGVMTLSMTVTGWSPSGADTYLTISWNQAGTQLSAGQSVAATITLTASPSTVGITSFSNTITISGIG